MDMQRFWGIQPSSSSAEKLVSSVGSMVAISAIFSISYYFTGFEGAMAILPSMGAAAVLLFAVPHGPLSQPWALFMGNMLSALVGVCCAWAIDNIFIAAGCAVGLSILAMHICHCIHPPGGATALAAVIGGEAIHALGFMYLLTPTLINCIVIFLVAVVFNNLFAWRRYPLGFMRFEKATTLQKEEKLPLRFIDKALSQLETVQDITPEQISHIVTTATAFARKERVGNFDLELGAFYTNGKAGRDWSVRQVVDESPHENPMQYMIIYRVVEGDKRHRSDSCSLYEFAQWAEEKMRPAGK